MGPQERGTYCLSSLHLTVQVCRKTYADDVVNIHLAFALITTIAALTTVNIRTIVVVMMTTPVSMTIVKPTTMMDVTVTTPNSTTITDVNTTIDATATIVATTTTHVRMTGVAITTIVNKMTTLTGIIAETPSNVPTITPKGIIVITRILVVMTTPTGGM